MIEFASCPGCHDGKVGFRLCSDNETVVLLCEECALVWTHPSPFDAAHARDPLSADFQRKHPGIKLRPSRWAEPKEIEAYGWAAYLLDPKDLLSP